MEETMKEVEEKVNDLVTELQKLDGVDKSLLKVVYADKDGDINVIHGVTVDGKFEDYDLDDLRKMMNSD